MIYNLESIDRTINRIIRDLGLGKEEIPYQDFIEWSADALEDIGSYYQFREKECLITIDDHRGLLPCDFMHSVRFREGCIIEPKGYGFWGGTLPEALNNACVDYECLNAYERFVIIPQGHNQVSHGPKQPKTLQFNKNLMGNVDVNKITSMDWNLNNNVITAAFRYGIIRVQYLAMPIDDRGFPLVPDDVSFRTALFWKIAMQLCMRDPKIFKNPQMQNLEYCSQKWAFYCKQARASANMPNLEMLERLKNNWYNLIPNINLEQWEYKNLGKPQQLDLNGRPQ
jgi:hypothetical protein